jgi:lipid-binding SYLF domain-containing protein
VANGSYFLAQAQGTFGNAYGRTDDPVQKHDQVQVYAVAGGLYGTCALGSIGFKIDHEANDAAYGAGTTAWDILDGKVPAPVGHAALTSRIDRLGTTAVAGSGYRAERTPAEAPSASRNPAPTHEE